MKFFDKRIGFFELLLFLLILFIYNYIAYSIVSDIPQHVTLLLAYLNGSMPVPTNFLYYYTIYAISFFNPDESILLFVAVYTLTIVTFWKHSKNSNNSFIVIILIDFLF
jgi:Na+/H+ antiporter NhaC